MVDVDAEVLAMSRACQAAQRRDPSLVPYIGPEDVLRRYQAGEIVTADECLTDQSPWIIEAIHHRAMARIQWMLRGGHD